MAMRIQHQLDGFAICLVLAATACETASSKNDGGLDSDSKPTSSENETGESDTSTETDNNPQTSERASCEDFLGFLTGCSAFEDDMLFLLMADQYIDAAHGCYDPQPTCTGEDPSRCIANMDNGLIDACEDVFAALLGP